MTSTDQTISVGEVLESLERLPPSWHGGGMITVAALRGIARHAPLGVERSAETGAGRSTLLLSHLSNDHYVFSVDGAGSLTRVRESSLLRRDHVRFIEGPSQLTLPTFDFSDPLDLVLLDGSHAFPVPEIDYFHLYPHVRTGGLLIVDDVQIPMIRTMFRFLKEDAMFDLLEVAGRTAFFKRTSAPTFDPLFGDWFNQRYNIRHFPWVERLKMRLPAPIRLRIKAVLGRR